jgi:hypothetical protein
MLAPGGRRRVVNAIADNAMQPNGLGIGGMGGMGGGGGRASQELRHDQRLGLTFSAEDLQHASYGRRVHIRMPRVKLASGASTTLFLPELPQLVEEVRVYAEHVHEKHPLAAFQLTLQENYQLPGGPGAVWKSNGYSGDVMIPRLVSGVPQLVTYAVDGLIEIRHEIPDPSAHVALPSTWTRDGDSLIETATRERVHHYRIQNEGEKSAVLFIEHRVADEDWFPVRNDALVQTQDSDEFRYRLRVPPGRTENFEVAERNSSRIVWTSRTNLAEIQLKLDDAALDPMAKKTLLQWATTIEHERSYVTQKERITCELQQTTQEQNRIKDLLTAVAREDELHKRYLEKLNKLEDEIDALQASLKVAQEQLDALRRVAGQVPTSSSVGR